MSYEDTYYRRFRKLIQSPGENIKLVLPFIKSRTLPYYRNALAKMHIDTYAKPYSGHADLMKYLNMKNGFFVQCGGNDGYGNDPTYYLEKIVGWKGIIVEPLPIYKLCKKNRKNSKVYNVAVGSFEDKRKTIDLVDCNAMSFVKGSIKNEKEWVDAGERTQNIKSKIISVPIVPIQKLLDGYFVEHGQKSIDLFVADVEGYELEVIKGLDFMKNSPIFILLEIHTEDRLKEIKEYLEGYGYVLITALGDADYMFKLKKQL